MESTNNYMNQQDFAKVVEAIPRLKIRKWYDYDVEMLFKILYWSALRPIEGIMLEREQFNTKDRIIRLRQTKTTKNDKAIIPQVFVEELEWYLKDKDDGRLLPGLTYDRFYHWLKDLGEMLNIEAWTTHQNETGEKTVGHIFRKSVGKDMVYGEILAKDGSKIPIPVISQHLRHKKPSMTIDHYLKSTSEQVRDTF